MVPYLLNGLQPGAILWGIERTMIYNENYVALIKALHPAALGSSAPILFGNVWDEELEPRWRSAELHGAARYENARFYLDRSGFEEEVYFTYSLTPLWDTNGKCCGVESRSFEVTRQVVVEARMLSLLRISESAASVTSLDDFWHGLVKAMTSNDLDFPLFALYSLRVLHRLSRLSWEALVHWYLMKEMVYLVQIFYKAVTPQDSGSSVTSLLSVLCGPHPDKLWDSWRWGSIRQDHTTKSIKPLSNSYHVRLKPPSPQFFHWLEKGYRQR